MFPASFVPYISKLIAPELTENIANHIAKIFKLPQVVNYMELPNDADIIGEKNQEHITMLAGEVSALEDRLKKLEILNKKAKKVK